MALYRTKFRKKHDVIITVLFLGLTLFSQIRGHVLKSARVARSPFPVAESAILFEDDELLHRKPDSLSQNQNPQLQFYSGVPYGRVGATDKDKELADRSEPNIKINNDNIRFVDPIDYNGSTGDSVEHTKDEFGLELRTPILDVPEFEVTSIPCENGQLIRFAGQTICSQNSDGNSNYVKRNNHMSSYRPRRPIRRHTYSSMYYG